MKLREKNKFKIDGVSTLRAWKPGVISRLLNENGNDLPSAIQQALSENALVHENTVHNLVVSAGKAFVCDLLLDIESTGITYHAIGTGTTTPSVGDTTMTSEQNRKTWTSRTRSAAVITFSEFYLASECTYKIKECGVFGGDSASETPDSGILFSHYQQPYDNSAGLVDLTFEYELEVS